MNLVAKRKSKSSRVRILKKTKMMDNQFGGYPKCQPECFWWRQIQDLNAAFAFGFGNQ
jgi:hypothetical protein